ncbi:unnamed protein product [Vicia faba]|uniref:Uncharacterized protein n=1 Tax=Vicia faba TaxID=3906 RepID=A0AAV0Z6K6_VICFA|nr:unnamed protein product [Vicia faba]
MFPSFSTNSFNFNSSNHHFSILSASTTKLQHLSHDVRLQPQVRNNVYKTMPSHSLHQNQQLQIEKRNSEGKRISSFSQIHYSISTQRKVSRNSPIGESPKSIAENSLSPLEFRLHRAFKHHLHLHLLNHFSEPPFSTFPYSLVITIHLHAITATHLHYQESLISNFIFLLSQPPLTHSSSNFCHSSTSPTANMHV